MHSSHSIDDISGSYCWCIKNQAYYSESFTVSTFTDERFNIFQKVYLETETSLKKEAPRKFYFPHNPKPKFAELEKIWGGGGGKFGSWETRMSRFDFREARETGNLA